ncbi:hypothetical protein FIU86_04445 [Roseovarius sp. THAF9]|nr:hypothetical protein FIU86_04445 [Roseovarius sp. THAF9]
MPQIIFWMTGGRFPSVVIIDRTTVPASAEVTRNMNRRNAASNVVPGSGRRRACPACCVMR